MIPLAQMLALIALILIAPHGPKMGAFVIAWLLILGSIAVDYFS